MKNKIKSFFITALVGLIPLYAGTARAELDYDTSNPLYMVTMGDVLSKTGLLYTDNILRVSQTFSYGVNNRLTLSGNINYQQDFDGSEDGFSNTDMGVTYRLSGGADEYSKILSDALFGIKFGGSSHVRDPEFADTIYYAGMRIGRKWAGVTLAGTIKTSWIFDEQRGMAYIDLIPEAYFRVAQNWMLGAGMDFRKATNPQFDQEWINTKIVRQYGRTQYTGHIDYEFESHQLQFGTRVNILF